MNICETKVIFKTENSLLQKLFDTAERKCLSNLKDFAGRKVLIEGGGYEKIWLETQPMGGEMYAKRNMEAAINNQLLFMEYARSDGRIPGSIALIDGKIIPQFNKFQGFCFPAPALNMYYLAGEDREYLNLLYTTLERFDEYLWRVRDTDGDACLESWCKYDTGEDNALRYGDAPNWWDKETPPEGYEKVPIASIDVMSYSYSARETLSKIAGILYKDDLKKSWEIKASEVKKKIRDYLWNDDLGMCIDRDRQHNPMLVKMHNTLRAMYWNSIDKDMADAFVYRHLLNPKEFWTNMPLPSVAIDDPLFKNESKNDWSGQPEALTYQRAIRALDNYGFEWIEPLLGSKLFNAIGEDCVFVQQYDPFTCKPSKVSLEGEKDAYGPAMLSTLEYIARMYGVHREGNLIYWGCFHGTNAEYEQIFDGESFAIKNSGHSSEGFINGKKIFGIDESMRVVTNLKGEVVELKSFEECYKKAK